MSTLWEQLISSRNNCTQNIATFPVEMGHSHPLGYLMAWFVFDDLFSTKSKMPRHCPLLPQLPWVEGKYPDTNYWLPGLHKEVGQQHLCHRKGPCLSSLTCQHGIRAAQSPQTCLWLVFSGTGWSQASSIISACSSKATCRWCQITHIAMRPEDQAHDGGNATFGWGCPMGITEASLLSTQN